MKFLRKCFPILEEKPLEEGAADMYLHTHLLKLLEVWLKLTVEDIVRHLNKRERNTILENLIEFPRLIERKTNTIYLAFFLKLNEIIPDGLILTISLKMMKKVSVKTIYSKNLQRIVESLSNRIITLWILTDNLERFASLYITQDFFCIAIG